MKVLLHFCYVTIQGWEMISTRIMRGNCLLRNNFFALTDVNPSRTSTQGYESVVCNRKSNTTLRQRHLTGQMIAWYLLQSRDMVYWTTMDFWACKKICFVLGTSITVAYNFSHYLIIPWKLIYWRRNTVTYSIFMCRILFFLNTNKLRTPSNITTMLWKIIFFISNFRRVLYVVCFLIKFGRRGITQKKT